MNNIKQASAIRQRHEWPRWTVRDVHIEKGGTYFELTEAETCLSVSAQVSELGVECLLSGHVLEVN